MHHKRKRHPNARSGCAMCKPQKKGNGVNPDKEMGHSGFGKIKKLIHTKEDLKNDMP
jgi:hypothetical protein